MEKDKEKYISQSIPVPAEFEDSFSHFYIAKNNTAQAIHKTLLPSFQTILVFSFGAEISFTSNCQSTIPIDKCVVLGPVKQPVNYTLTPGADMLVINFKLDAFYRFFGQAIASSQFPVHPDELLNDNCFANLRHILKDLDTLTERINFILEFCKPYLKKADADLLLVANFESNSPLDPVKSAALETNQSTRTIQLKHKKRLGYSAKEINRYQRFLQAIELLENIVSSGNKKVDWFEVIDQCGYYDQSQLIHDFNHYLGLSPGQFLKFQQDICITRPQ
ncbi:MAG: helix-turn-helix domain-containing protein [Ferruginibacter sp.]